MQDMNNRILRSIIDPYLSFMEDPARMLRAIRLAARVGLTIETETAKALKQLGAGVLTLPALRLTMEVNSLMAYGSAAQSLKLMWHFDILELLLPLHAEYLQKNQVSKDITDSMLSSNLLISLLSEIDKSVHTSEPADPSLYMAALACPLIAEQISKLNQNKSLSQSIKSGETTLDVVGGNKVEDWQQVQPLPVVQQPSNYREVVTSVILEMVRSTPVGFEVVLPYGAAGDAVELLLAEHNNRCGVESQQLTEGRRESTVKRLARELKILSDALAAEHINWVALSEIQL
eukprot:TRINITY_DN981_c0_g2_i1.p1 TRINITY_DN981_c0_g2~~TRINITY_DN981_c0_g2_i1.p1  ORF type:complete len:289 (-),score=41.82 TRINITY_DN981_c0_g2_i1:161-1027(-)